MKYQRFYSALTLIALCVSPAFCMAYFFEGHEEGWFWYEPSELAPQSQEVPHALPAPLTLNPTQAMQAYQAQVQDSLNLAILHPTEANLKAYARWYFRTMDKAQYFTDAYQRMLLKNPVFDYALDFPISAPAHQIYAKQQRLQNQEMIQNFAKEQGLFFFFSGACAYCKVFAPVVRAFAKQYGVSILAISMDGQGLSEFPEFVTDQGASHALKVQRVPALLAINPKTNVVSPLATGAISQSQLEENILRVLKYAHAQGHPHE